MINNVTVTLPRTLNNQLDTSQVTIQAQNVKETDICLFLNPLVAFLNDIHMSERTGFKDA